jgi:hypothetical protein
MHDESGAESMYDSSKSRKNTTKIMKEKNGESKILKPATMIKYKHL